MIVSEKEISERIISKLDEEIFIYPTDTIYGIGCNALDGKLVEKIRKIKKRDSKPFSIIAPNIAWILDNFKINKKEISKYLPGPYTLVLKKKNPDLMNWISQGDSVGIRIPNNNFTKVLQELGVPIVTTSVNLSGEKFANSVKEIDPRIKSKIKIIIDAGTLSGKPSTIVKEGKIIERK